MKENKTKRKPTRTIDFEEEVLVNEHGIEYQKFTITETSWDEEKEAMVDEVVLKGNLYHHYNGRKFDYETKEEVEIRRKFIKDYQKRLKRGRGSKIWLSKNTKAVNDYLTSKLTYNYAAIESGEEPSEDNKAMLKIMGDRVGEMHIRAKQTNMGTLNKKKIQEYLDKQKEEENGRDEEE